MASEKKQVTEKELSNAFRFFNEIGILSQLSKAMFEKELPKDMQVVHFSVLNNLSQLGDGKLPSDLARAFQLPRSNMTDILNKLESKKYISTKVNPKDKRSKCVFITQKGEDFRLESIMSLVGPTKELAQFYDLNKMEKLIPKLSELKDIMDTMREE